MRTQNLPARFVEEHDVLEIASFKAYIEQVKNGRGDDIETLLQSCETYLNTLDPTSAAIIVMDSILPCWDWLVDSNCNSAEIVQFSQSLASKLEAFNPALILVEGDLSIALGRAIQDRGMEWALNKGEQRGGAREVDAYLAYLERLREGMVPNLPHWPFKIVRVNTIDNPIEQALGMVTNGLKIKA